jgi:uncharacterized membrane protein
MNKPKPKAAGHSVTKQDAHDQLGLERLIFFSDAVFAIAITLLALEIRLPAGEAPLEDGQLYIQLTGMWQKYLAYMLSFLVIGSFWAAHHRKFRYIQRYDSRLLMLNLLLLMVIAFIPFPSSVISESSGQTATIFYAITMILPGIFMAIIWWYASWKDRLTAPGMDRNQRRQEFIRPLVTALVFLLSIGIATINSDLARLSWILILPVTLFAKQL